jgi:hypothetical protein
VPVRLVNPVGRVLAVVREREPGQCAAMQAATLFQVLLIPLQATARESPTAVQAEARPIRGHPRLRRVRALMRLRFKPVPEQQTSLVTAPSNQKTRP